MGKEEIKVQFEHLFVYYDGPQLFSTYEEETKKKFLCLKYDDDLYYAVEVNEEMFMDLLNGKISLDKIFVPSENYQPQYYDCIIADNDSITLNKRGEMDESDYPGNYFLADYQKDDYIQHILNKEE